MRSALVEPGQETPDWTLYVDQQQRETPRYSPSHEEIAALAYTLWQERGCPEGHDLEIWLEAEAELTADSSLPKVF